MRNITVYECKDGRTRAYDKDTKKVVSYPRILLEEKLGRKLESYEQVHHIDGDPLNNRPDNLELTILGEHQRGHNIKYVDKEVTCYWCGKPFIWTALKQRSHYGNHTRHGAEDSTIGKPFCSKQCVGKYGQMMQVNRGDVAE